MKQSKKKKASRRHHQSHSTLATLATLLSVAKAQDQGSGHPAGGPGRVRGVFGPRRRRNRLQICRHAATLLNINTILLSFQWEDESVCVRPRGHLVTLLLLLDHLEGRRKKGTEGWSSGGKKMGGGHQLEMSMMKRRNACLSWEWRDCSSNEGRDKTVARSESGRASHSIQDMRRDETHRWGGSR